MSQAAVGALVVFVGVPLGWGLIWALIWALCVAINKWAKR